MLHHILKYINECVYNYRNKYCYKSWQTSMAYNDQKLNKQIYAFVLQNPGSVLGVYIGLRVRFFVFVFVFLFAYEKVKYVRVSTCLFRLSKYAKNEKKQRKKKKFCLGLILK